MAFCAPRFKVGDRVQTDLGKTAVVTRVQFGYELDADHCFWAESRLEPAPVVCAPDGTRCAWWRHEHPNCEGQLCTQGFRYCPNCGGELGKG